MSDDITVLAGKVDSMSGTLERVLSAIEKQASTAEQLVQAMARHDAHSQQQAQINQEVQLALKDLGGRLRQVELTQARAVIHDEAIESIRESVATVKATQAAQEERLREVEKSTLINTTRMAPIWAILVKVAGGVALLAAGFFVGTK